MANLQNLTPFAAIAMPSMDKAGREVLLLCVAGRFCLPEANIRHYEAPPVNATQAPPVMADEYHGKPDASSLRYEGQSAYTRPATDIYVLGHAHAPGGEPVTRMGVGIQIGARRHTAVVTGDRVWERTLVGGMQISPPVPFTSLPLMWERAFGGAAVPDGDAPPQWEPRNPVGVGWYGSAAEAVGRPLPNIEHPEQLIRGIEDRPEPVGFGPIARAWMPRRTLGGTYDAHWVENRAPFWPDDLDERFFCGAPPPLQHHPHLTGGERVLLAGLHPGGMIDFPLPQLRLITHTRFKTRTDQRGMVLDALLIEPDQGWFTLIWRASVPAGRDLAGHASSTVRVVEPWETGA